MKGTLKKINEQWLVYYYEDVMSGVTRLKELPLYPQDFETLSEFNDYEFGDGTKIFDELPIQFEIIDEFTHPKLYNGLAWGTGKFAKLL
jgi:hypothetical protein